MYQNVKLDLNEHEFDEQTTKYVKSTNGESWTVV